MRVVNSLSFTRLRVQSHNFFSCLIIIIGITFYSLVFHFIDLFHSFVFVRRRRRRWRRRLFAQTQIPTCPNYRLSLVDIANDLFVRAFVPKTHRDTSSNVCTEIEINSQPTGVHWIIRWFGDDCAMCDGSSSGSDGNEDDESGKRKKLVQSSLIEVTRRRPWLQ